jgi:hypothetical protein
MAANSLTISLFIFGLVLLLSLIAFLIYWFLFHKKKKKKEKKKDPNEDDYLMPLNFIVEKVNK